MNIHVVQLGDTLWSVANLYGISIERIIICFSITIVRYRTRK